MTTTTTCWRCLDALGISDHVICLTDVVPCLENLWKSLKQCNIWETQISYAEKMNIPKYKTKLNYYLNLSTILIFVFGIVTTVCYFLIRFTIKHSKPNSDIRRSYKSHQNKIPICLDLAKHTHTRAHARTHPPTQKNTTHPHTFLPTDNLTMLHILNVMS
jgi:hypothetical protein